jgi:hypothetical protein
MKALRLFLILAALCPMLIGGAAHAIHNASALTIDEHNLSAGSPK